MNNTTMPPKHPSNHLEDLHPADPPSSLHPAHDGLFRLAMQEPRIAKEFILSQIFPERMLFFGLDIRNEPQDQKQAKTGVI